MSPRHVSVTAHATSPLLPVTRTDIELRPDPRRVVLKPFLPDDQVFPDGGLLDRVLALSEEEVVSTLSHAVRRFETRHPDLKSVLIDHYRFVAREAHALPELSTERRLLIGAYYTREYSIEAAALTNPSIVPAPDQSGLEPGAQRFIMSLRGIGEGHMSSIEFRSGVIGQEGGISIAEPSRHAFTGSHSAPILDKKVFSEQLREIGSLNDIARSVIDPLPDRFELVQLEDAIALIEGTHVPRRLSDATCKTIHWLATSNYRVQFAAESDLSGRVLFPGSAVESNGLEDARFVRFVDDDGSVTYYATYTAYNGQRVVPQLIETVDFLTFRIDTLAGAGAKNKGVAIFPRKIKGRFAALSRYDTENNYVMFSDSVRIWERAEKIQSPAMTWDLARIGNCGSPLETDAGWLVITHGVGPFRTYSLGAMLLDIDEPSRVIGRLDEPLIVASETEREGYVPNVVYSCGSMIHAGELILPYGESDMACKIATVSLGHLLAELAG